jgi:hypothetical protein
MCRHRQLHDPQPGTRRLRQHLGGPAIGHLAWIERQQRLTTDRAHGGDVAHARAVEQPQGECANGVAGALLRCERAGRPVDAPTRSERVRMPFESARAHRQIGRARQHKPRHPRRAIEVVAAVGIHQQHGVGTRCRPNTRQAGVAVSSTQLAHHLGTGSAGNLGGAVAAAVVHYDDARQRQRLERRMRPQRAHLIAHRSFFVERRQHNRQRRLRSRLRTRPLVYRHARVLLGQHAPLPCGGTLSGIVPPDSYRMVNNLAKALRPRPGA